MKLPFPAIKLIGVLLLVAYVTGCESNKVFKEDELAQAGFQKVPATTAAQQAHLTTLSKTKVSPIERNGTMYYVFPDVAHNVLYVGRQAEYNVYKMNKSAMEANADDDLEAQDEFVGDDAYLTSFDSWGPWEGLPWAGY